jgi:hypothetical protein
VQDVQGEEPDQLAATLGRLEARVEQLRRSGDDRRVFLAVYATMTRAIHRGVAEGRFVDPGWTAAATMRATGDVTGGRLRADTLVRRRHDYEVVNHILAETIRDAQAVLARESRASAWLDALTLRLDEYVAELLLRASRTQGWHNALALAVARDVREEEAVRQHLERVACSYVQRIDLTQLVPGGRLRTALGRVRPPFTDAIDLAPPRRPRRRAL